MIKCECLHHDLIFFVTTSIFGNKNNVSLKTTGHASWDLSRNEVNTPSGELGNLGNIMIPAPTSYFRSIISILGKISCCMQSLFMSKSPS